MKKTFLLAMTLVGGFSLIVPVHAHDAAVLSPKAKEQRDSLKTVRGITTVDLVDRSTEQGSPKSRELEQSVRRVEIIAPSLNIVNAPRPALAPKDPRYESALRENAIREVEIAPLK